jgi:ATP-binding cassette subfamily B protein
VALLLGVIVLDGALAVAVPVTFQLIINDGVLAFDVPALVRLSLIALVLALLGGINLIGLQWLSNKIGNEVGFQLRNEALAHAQQLPVGFYTHQRSGALVSRLNNDTMAAQQFFSHSLRQIVSGTVRILFVLTTIAVLSLPVLLVVLVMPMLIMFPARWVGRSMKAVSHRWMRSFADLTTFVTERLNISGSLLHHLYGNGTRDQRTYGEINARNRDLGVRQAMIAGVFSSALASVSTATIAMIYLVGGYSVVTGSMTIGALVALTLLAMRLFGPLQALSSTQVELMGSLASFERIFELLDRRPPDLHRPPSTRRLPADASTLELDRVQFAYQALPGLDRNPTPGADAPVPVLRDVSFRVPTGQRVAVVGPSGAGKSTIAALAARLYEPDEGTVRVAGTDVREVADADLRRTVGVLTQDAYFLHDTIRANLRYAAPDADEQRLVEACRAAQIWPLIRELPDGLDTVVGDRGYRLSGGEKQRLAIARLLLKDPRIVVLDEATAHLDTESERLVQQALDRCLAGRTTLVIAHRLSTVRNADEILVLAEGRIVQRGRHEELVRQPGLYARLHQEQDGGQVVARPGSPGRAPSAERV